MSDTCQCGCGGIVRQGRKFLRGHHWKVRTPEQYFWPRVLKTDDCWIWTGPVSNSGYGVVMFQRKNYLVHRLSYELHFGPIPDDMWVLHRCDNPICVRPDHLFLGTPQDNTSDMIAKNRRISPTPNPKRGQEHPMAKLTGIQVDKIRSLYATGQYKQANLARRYGVTRTTICDILHGRIWKHRL